MALSPRDRLRLHSLGLWDGLPDAQRRGLDVEPISGLTALAEGRLAASYSQEAKVVTARSRSVRRERIQHPPRWGPWTSNAPSTAASVSRSGLGGAAKPRMWWPCWRSSRASIQAREVQILVELAHDHNHPCS